MKPIKRFTQWASKYDWRNYIIYYTYAFIVVVFVIYVALSYIDILQHNMVGDAISKYNFFNLFKYRGE